MGTYAIRTPDIGEGIAEVELVAWHVKPGDEVKEDQVLADVMTDKATVEIPSPVSGKIVDLLGEVGKTIAVGAELVRLEVEGAGNVKSAAASQSVASAVPAKSPQAVSHPHAQAMPAPDEEKEAPTPAKRPPAHAPVAMRPAGEKPIASPAVRRRS